MTGWRDHLAGDLAADVGHLDRALGLALRERAFVEALLDPRGPLFQRLEYVGDAILDAVLLQSLVLLEPWTEPDLSVVNGEQQALVSDHALGKVAARRGLPRVRAFGASSHRLGDRIEASIGAAWADSGIRAAESVAVRLVVGPGLAELPRPAGVPESEGSASYQRAAMSFGHEPVTPQWYGAAAGGGAPRRRLAAVGNAVLEAALSTAQYVDAPAATEAEMSEERRTATSNAVLAVRALALGLSGAGDGGRGRGVGGGGDADDRRAVADEVQALVGAVTMDGGTAAGFGVAAGVLRRRVALGPVPLVGPAGPVPL